MKNKLYQYCVAIVYLLPFPTSADTLTLKDGSTVKGKITNIGISEI